MARCFIQIKFIIHEKGLLGCVTTDGQRVRSSRLGSFHPVTGSIASIAAPCTEPTATTTKTFHTAHESTENQSLTQTWSFPTLPLQPGCSTPVDCKTSHSANLAGDSMAAITSVCILHLALLARAGKESGCLTSVTFEQARGSRRERRKNIKNKKIRPWNCQRDCQGATWTPKRSARVPLVSTTVTVPLLNSILVGHMHCWVTAGRSRNTDSAAHACARETVTSEEAARSAGAAETKTSSSKP